MTIYLENETDVQFDFDMEETVHCVVEKVLEQEKCPYETTINILLTDDQGIRQFTFGKSTELQMCFLFPILRMKPRQIFSMWKKRRLTVLNRIQESLYWGIL